MKEKTKEFLTELGGVIASRQLDQACEHLAAWLPKSAHKRFKAELLAKERQVRTEFSDVEIGEPDGFNLDHNPCSVNELRNNGVDLPSEITESNFVEWCCLTVTADEEEWSLFDLWCAVIEDDRTYKVGYFEVLDPD